MAETATKQIHPPLLPGSSSSFALIHSRTNGLRGDEQYVTASQQQQQQTSTSNMLLKSLSHMLSRSSSSQLQHGNSNEHLHHHNHHGSSPSTTAPSSPHGKPTTMSFNNVGSTTVMGTSVIKEDDLFSDNGHEESEEDYYDLVVNKYTTTKSRATATTGIFSFLWNTCCAKTSLFALEFTDSTLHNEFQSYLFRVYDSGRYKEEKQKLSSSVKKDLLRLWLLITLFIITPQVILQTIYDFQHHEIDHEHDFNKKVIRHVVSIVVLISVGVMLCSGGMMYWSHVALPSLVSTVEWIRGRYWSETSNTSCWLSSRPNVPGSIAIWPMASASGSQKASLYHLNQPVIDIEQPITISREHSNSFLNEPQQHTHQPLSLSSSTTGHNNSNSHAPPLSSNNQTSFINHSHNQGQSINHHPISTTIPLSHLSMTSKCLRCVESLFFISIQLFCICIFLRVSLSLNSYVTVATSLSMTVFHEFHSVIVDIFGGHGNISSMSFHRLHSMSTNTALLMMFLLPAICYRLIPHVSFFITSILFSIAFIVFFIVCLSITQLRLSLSAGCVYAIIAWLLIREERICILIEFLQKKDNREKLLSQCKNVEDACDNEMRHLIANVAHDLKTPLTSFMTGIDYIQYSIDEFQISNPTWLSSLLQSSSSLTHSTISTSFTMKPFVELLESIQGCVTNIQNTNMFMLMIINRCIDYSKVSKGIKLLPRNETVDLIETVLLPLTCMQNIQNKITITLLPLGSRSNSELEGSSNDIHSPHIKKRVKKKDNEKLQQTKKIEPLPKICTHIITDRLWLQENLLNLLSNAVKYSTSGETTVSISLERVGDDHEELSEDDVGVAGEEDTVTDEVEPVPVDADVKHTNPKRFNKTRREFSARCPTTGEEADFDVHSANEETGHEDVPPGMQKLPVNDGESTAPPLLDPVAFGVPQSSSGSIRYEHHLSGNLVQPTVNTNPAERRFSLNLGDYSKFTKLLGHSNASTSANKDDHTKAPQSITHHLHQHQQQHGHSNMAQLARSLSKQHSKVPSSTSNLLLHHPHPNIISGSNMVSSPSSEQSPQLFLRFEIEDSGVGMSDHAMKNLFNPFQQTQRFTGGAGLGLFSLSKRVEALGGKYGVSHRRDGKQGSLFWFTIPYRPDEVYADVVAQMNADSSVANDDTLKEATVESNHMLPNIDESDENASSASHSFAIPGSRSRNNARKSTLLSSFSKEEQNEVFQAVRDAIRNTMTKVSFASTLQSFSSIPSSGSVTTPLMTRSSVMFTPTNGSLLTPLVMGQSFSSSIAAGGGMTPTEKTRGKSITPTNKAVTPTNGLGVTPPPLMGNSILGSHSGERERDKEKDREIHLGLDRGRSLIFSTIEEVITPAASERATPVKRERKQMMAASNNDKEVPHSILEYDEKNENEESANDKNESNTSISTGGSIMIAPLQIQDKKPFVNNIESNPPTVIVVQEKRKSSLPMLKVLVVDDSPAILKMCSMMIKKLGHQTSSAENGEIAVQMCIKEREKGIESNPDGEGGGFDVILMDLQMPVLDGLEAAKRIRALPNASSPSSSSKKEFIIGFSANSDIETQEAALSAGMDIFMPKPFNVANFISAIAHINHK